MGLSVDHVGYVRSAPPPAYAVAHVVAFHGDHPQTLWTVQTCKNRLWHGRRARNSDKSSSFNNYLTNPCKQVFGVFCSSCPFPFSGLNPQPSPKRHFPAVSACHSRFLHFWIIHKVCGWCPWKACASRKLLPWIQTRFSQQCRPPTDYMAGPNIWEKMWHNTSSWSRKILKHNLYMTENASPNTTTLAQPCRPLTSLMAFVDQVTLLYFLNVRLYWRSVVMAEDQPTASKPVKDGTGPMVLIRPSPAPDSTCITTNQHHSRDDYFSPWPQCVQWLGRQHAGSRDCYCESVFCNATTTVCDGIFQIKPIWALVVSKVDNCCSVLVGISGHLLNRLQSVLDLCRPTCVLRKAFWTNHATPLRHRLVASSRVDTLPPLCSEWCTVVWMAQPCRSSQTASVGQPTSTAVVTSTRRLRQLVFLPVRRSTPGD